MDFSSADKWPGGFWPAPKGDELFPFFFCLSSHYFYKPLLTPINSLFVSRTKHDCVTVRRFQFLFPAGSKLWFVLNILMHLYTFLKCRNHRPFVSYRINDIKCEFHVRRIFNYIHNYSLHFPWFELNLMNMGTWM